MGSNLSKFPLRVSSATGEVETELFFADSTPGMPVLTRVREAGGAGGEVVETAQVFRCVEQAASPCAR